MGYNTGPDAQKVGIGVALVQMSESFIRSNLNNSNTIGFELGDKYRVYKYLSKKQIMECCLLVCFAFVFFISVFSEDFSPNVQDTFFDFFLLGQELKSAMKQSCDYFFSYKRQRSLFANGKFRICKDLDCGIGLNSLLP